MFRFFPQSALAIELIQYVCIQMEFDLDGIQVTREKCMDTHQHPFYLEMTNASTCRLSRLRLIRLISNSSRSAKSASIQGAAAPLSARTSQSVRKWDRVVLPRSPFFFWPPESRELCSPFTQLNSGGVKLIQFGLLFLGLLSRHVLVHCYMLQELEVSALCQDELKKCHGSRSSRIRHLRRRSPSPSPKLFAVILSDQFRRECDESIFLPE